MKKLSLIFLILLWCNISSATGSGCYVSVDIDMNLDNTFDGIEDIRQGFIFTLDEADRARQEATKKRGREQGREGTHLAWSPIKQTCTSGTNDRRERTDLYSHPSIFLGCVNPEGSSYKPITIAMAATLEVLPASNLGPSFARPYLYIESETKDDNNEIITHRFMDLGQYTSFQLGKLDGREGDHGSFIIQKSLLKKVQLSEDLTRDVIYAIICRVDTSRTDIFGTGLH